MGWHSLGNKPQKNKEHDSQKLHQMTEKGDSQGSKNGGSNAEERRVV